jgi:hypothetical protein
MIIVYGMSCEQAGRSPPSTHFLVPEFTHSFKDYFFVLLVPLELSIASSVLLILFDLRTENLNPLRQT